MEPRELRHIVSIIRKYNIRTNCDTHEANDRASNDDVPCRIRVGPACVWQRTAVKTLRFEAFVKADVGDCDTEPSHQTCNRCHIREPAEHLSGATADGHVCKEREEGTENNGYERQSAFRRVCKDLGCISRESKAVDCTR